MPTSSHSTVLRIAADHPSLPGHFPGQPVVPGVLLLDRIIDAAQAWLGHPISVRSLPQVKFVAPLLPDKDAHLELSLADSNRGGELRELRFVVRRDATVVAQGILNFSPPEAAP